MLSLKRSILAALTCSLLLSSIWAAKPLSYEVIATYPHDSKAWTQGLYYADGELYESTGLYGQSTLRRVDLKTGEVLQQTTINRTYFAEGLTRFQDKLYQLTWQAERGFIYDANTLEKTGSFRYKGEGWGLTHDASHLIMSDGTDTLRFLNPTTFKTERTVQVTLNTRPLKHLNELEYVDGYIYANVWYQDYIAKIDPADGTVVSILDLSDLFPQRPRDEGAVLNGIAYIEAEQHFLITGKFWPKLFAIKLVP